MKQPSVKSIIGLCLSVLLILWVRSIFFNPWINLDACLEHPQKYHGRQITQFREPRILEITGDGFILGQKQLPPVLVRCDTSGLRVQEYVGLVAFFHKDGYLTADRVQIAEKRRIKIWMSTFPLFFVLILFIRYFRFDLRIFRFVRSKDA